MDWAESELSSISLGDKRLNARAKKVLYDLGRDISASIPEANNN